MLEDLPPPVVPPAGSQTFCRAPGEKGRPQKTQYICELRKRETKCLGDKMV